MDRVNIAVNSTSRFSLQCFRISAALVGAKHEFMFDDCPTLVQLPTAEMESATFDADCSIRCDTWKSEGTVPLEYQVSSIGFEIQLKESIDIPEKLLTLPPKQIGLLADVEVRSLDAKVEGAADILRRAFSYWLSVLRWKSGIGYIGEPSIEYAGAGECAALTDRTTGHRVWVQTAVIVVPGIKAVTAENWRKAQTALSENKEPPIWFEFLFEARMRINNKDFVGAVLTLAVAFEVNLRKIFSAELEAFDLDPVTRQIFDLANLRALLTRLKKTRRWSNDWEAATDIATLHQLMDCRDGVMHMAKVENLDEGILRKMYAAVEKFAYFTTLSLGLD